MATGIYIPPIAPAQTTEVMDGIKQLMFILTDSPGDGPVDPPNDFIVDSQDTFGQ